MRQDAYQAIKDVNILAKCIKRNNYVEQAFKQYDAHRQKRIQDLYKQCWQPRDELSYLKQSPP
ncbi:MULTISPECIES: hypothetical protein [unclassified Lysinibacillus]|uniref:hypothetical protein n=1 Tax=unclassified Lysinibacillus TaxID=2636778 RepID=UPI0035DD34A7